MGWIVRTKNGPTIARRTKRASCQKAFGWADQPVGDTDIQCGSNQEAEKPEEEAGYRWWVGGGSAAQHHEARAAKRP